MQPLILHGGGVNLDLAKTIASQAGGELESRDTFWRLHGHRMSRRRQLDALRQQYPVDINALPPDFDIDGAGLLVTDMDSTLINIECIDEIADFAQLKNEVAAITEAAMRGELDFKASLTQRVALLAGLPVSVLDTVYNERLQPNDGAQDMVDGLHAAGLKIALVSGGFTHFTEKLQQRLGLDYTLANTLDVKNARLTGKIDGALIGAVEKAIFLNQTADELGLEPEQTIAMGDGANDLKMMTLAGMGIAYRAKPRVQAEADCALNYSTLAGVLELLDTRS